MFGVQSSSLSRSSSYHESGSHHSFLHIILRDRSLHLSDEDICRFLSHCYASLFHGGKHRVARLGTVAIGKTADTDVIRHSVSHALGGIEDADGGIVVDGEESIRHFILLQDFRRDSLSLRTVVADSHPVRVLGQPMLHDGIMVTVVSVLEISMFIGEP